MKKSFIISITFLFFVNASAQWNFIKIFNNAFDGSAKSIMGFNDSIVLCTMSKFLSASSGNLIQIKKTSDYGANWSTTFSQSGFNYWAGDPQYLGGDTAAISMNSTGVGLFRISNDKGSTWPIDISCGGPSGVQSFHFLNTKYRTYISAFVTTSFKRCSPYTSTINSPFTNPTTPPYLKNHKDVFIVTSGTNLLSSADSGFTWSTILTTTVTITMNSLIFTSANKGYIACNNGQVLKTTNGGTTWVTLNTGYNNNLNSISFKNDSVGYCVGDSGLVLSTKNGGLTWKKEAVPTLEKLIKVIAIHKKAYVLSTIGELFRRDIDTCTIFPSVSLSAASPTLCPKINATSAVPLTGSPSGGTYFSNIINTFYFYNSTPGVYNTGYFYTDPSTGCSSTSLITMTVVPGVNVSLSLPTNTACTATTFGQPIICVGTPTGGVYYGSVSSNTFAPQSAAGTYSVIYNYTDPLTGCYDTQTQTITVVSCVGINELQNKNETLHIYPNPTNGILNVRCSINQDLKMYNIYGELIFQTTFKEEKMEINMVNQPSGIYFIRIGPTTKKIIKG